MRDPCRVCGVCVQGGQCRWLFSACGRLRLAVVLSHVLGLELQRDGRSEFLCGKCVFLLERIVQCDVTIGQLQETHAAQLQQLEKERDGLKTQITNKYRQHNPTGSKLLKWDVQTGACLYTPKQLQSIQCPQPKQSRISDIQETTRRNRKVVSANLGCEKKFAGSLRRCVSLEPLCKVGTDRSHRSKLNSRLKAADVPAPRPRSLSRDYLDVVNKKSSLSRSISLQSVALENTDHALIRQTRPFRGSTPAAVEKTSLVFDILQLLKIVQGVRFVPRCGGSRIPVLKHPLRSHANTHKGGVSWKSRVERNLREMEDEFNDDYRPLKREVHTRAVRF